MPDPNSKHICIIGSGASGLTAIKCCLEDGHRVTCYEMTDDIGGLWRYSEELVGKERACVMKSTVINTSKEMMAYSDFPMPDNYPVFTHNTMVLQYFRLYANKFDLIPHIKFLTKVDLVQRANDYDDTGHWLVKTTDVTSGKVSEKVYDGVLLATGHHASPYEPAFEGLDTFQGQVLHAHDYRHYRGFEDKSVLVVGIGNSGGDIAVELAGIAKNVHLSTRRGAWVFFRISDGGYPVDMLFGRRWLRALGRWFPSITEAYAQMQLNKKFNHTNYGLRPKHGVFSQHPMVNDSLPNRIASGLVTLKPDVTKFTYDGVIFEDGSEIHGLDAVILATGYTIGFPYLEDGIFTVKKNVVDLYKYVFPPKLKHPTLGVLGCIQPLGAVMPISEIQSRWFSRVMRGECKLPSASAMLNDIRMKQEEMRKKYIDSQRHTIQVDYVEYMDEIGVMIGCKPSFYDLLTSDPLLALEVFVGPITPYQYRLSGPHTWSGAKAAIESHWTRTVLGSRPSKLPYLQEPIPNQKESLIYDILKTCIVGFIILVVMMLLFTD